MATVQLSDIQNRRKMAAYTTELSTKNSALFESRVFMQDQKLAGMFSEGGLIQDIPSWDDLGDTDANTSSDDPDSHATPEKVTSKKHRATILHRNKGYSAMDLAAVVAGEDPIKSVVEYRIGPYWKRHFNATAISIARGLLADNVANDGGDMLVEAAQVGDGSVTAASRFSNELIIDAAHTMGDAAEELGAIAVHSSVRARMLKEDDIEFKADSAGAMTIELYKGLRVIVSDTLPAEQQSSNPIVYTSILFGAGFFHFGDVTMQQKEPVGYERDESAGQGGGMEEIWSRRSFWMHPDGFDYTDASNAGPTPTNAELAIAGNWDRVFQRKNCKIAFLKSHA